eukprot:SAG11_NODE_31990_length_287_cov_0.909574_1_plen_74_part_01
MRGSKSQISSKFNNIVPAGKKPRVPLISFFCHDPKSKSTRSESPGTDNEVPNLHITHMFSPGEHAPGYPRTALL